MKLSIEEKAVVSRYISEDMSIIGALKAYWPWLIPVIGFALHGVITQDYISGSVANALFIFYVFWFFSAGSKEGQTIKSALQKYENEVSALGE